MDIMWHGQEDIFSFKRKLCTIFHDIKMILKKEKLQAIINNKRYDIIGRIGMYHIIIDIKDDDIKINDVVYLDVKTIYINSELRREYI